LKTDFSAVVERFNVTENEAENGQVIQDLLTIERPANPAPPTASEPDEGEMRAVVKFFNDIHG